MNQSGKKPEASLLYTEPEIERALISRILIGRKGTGEAITPPTMRPSRFSLERHRYIWEAIVGQGRVKAPTDHASIIAVLRTRGTLKKAGGVNYVSGLTEPGTVEDLGYYAARLTSAAARRCLGPIGEKISDLATRDENEDILSIPSRFRVLANRAERLADLSTRNGSSKGVKVKDIYTFASEPPDPIKWVYEPWLCPGDMVIFGGEAGLGKSWVSLDLMLALALGQPFMGLDNQAGRQSVLYVDEENNERLVRYRINKLTVGLGVGLQDLDPAVMQANYAFENDFNFDDPAALDRLGKLCRDLQPDWIIYDSLVRIHRREENSNSDMSTLLGSVGSLARQVKSGVIVVHHLGKSTKDRPSSRIADRLRGASAIRGWADQIWGLEGVDQDLRISHVKGRMTQATPRILALEDTESGMGVRIAAADAVFGAEELILEALAKAGEDGMLRQVLVGELEDSSFKSAKRLSTQILGKFYRDQRVRKARERAGTRYWLAEYAKGE